MISARSGVNRGMGKFRPRVGPHDKPTPHQADWGLLSVPGPIAPQRYTRTVRNLGDKPQCAGRRHDQTKRVRSQDALPLATLVSAQAIEGARITNGHFHPAVAIFVQDVEGTQRQIGGRATARPSARCSQGESSARGVISRTGASTRLGPHANGSGACRGCSQWACPALVVCVWPHGPPRPPQTASAVRVGVLRGEGASLRELGRKDRDGTGRLKGGEDRGEAPACLMRVSASTT